MPAARPVTPMSRHGGAAAAAAAAAARSGSAGPRSNMPGPSGTTTLPLHVSTVGRPRTPTTPQRRAPPSGGSSGGASGGSGTELNINSRDSAPSRPDSSQGNYSSGGNGATTVISSALDYKRFLDRRKQMIQQQVETAQQASAARQDAPSRASPEAQGRDSDSDEGAVEASPPAFSGLPGGWSPGATGPVKANHCLPGTDASAAAGHAEALRRRLATGPLPGTDSPSGDGSFEDPASGPGSARSFGTSAVAQTAQRRAQTPQPQPPRAQTPTRYTQSASGAASAAVAAAAAADADARSRSSLPAGGARQACKSLGQNVGGICDLLRGDFGTDTLGASGAEAFVDLGGDSSTPMSSSGGLGTTIRVNKQRSDSSVDALWRQDMEGELRPASRQSSGGGADQRRSSSERDNRGDILTGNTVEDYIIGKQIGQGAYATVCFGLHKETSRKVAIKIYEKYKLLDPQRRKSVRCEIRLMERLRHPNIVIFHEALDTSKQIYLVMDFVGGGSMHHFLKKRPGRRLEDQVAKRLFYQVCQGIRYLHDRHVVHRDVKLENLLLDEAGTVKIIDFGFSTIVPPGKKLKIFCGTPSYMSPEIVARKEYSGFCADIWAMGVLLYALLCGSFPFRGQNDRDLYRKIIRGVFQILDHVGTEARNLLNRVMLTDMARRPTVDETLADPWLHGHRDELYSSGKATSTCYQPNSSTSSTATTAAPSSSVGQSARDISAIDQSPSGAGSGGGTSRGGGAASSLSGRLGATSGTLAMTSVPTGGAACSEAPLPPGPPPPLQALTGAGALPGSAAAVVPAVGSALAAVEASGDEPKFSKRLEEEALCKLERLGYPRDEILRQLKDESSQLYKLYHRFLKALTAWDCKK